MPELNGLEATRQLLKMLPQTEVLILTMHENEQIVREVLDAGARGYVLKRSAAEELVRAVRVVFAGDLHIDPAIAGKLLSGKSASSPSLASVELSQREEEVLKFAAQGFSNKEAATKLALSVKTVETYKARAAEKLGLRTRAEIVRYGASRGWLDRS